MTAIWPRLLLFALLAALYLLGIGVVGVIDYDEAVYAEVARAMFLHGDWIAPSLGGVPFFEKPPLLYWSEIVGYQALGVGAAGARVPNALAALATAVALWWFARRPLGERTALRAALMLGMSMQWIVQARVAITDMWLTLFLVLTVGALHRGLEQDRQQRGSGLVWLLVAAAAGGLAMLTKGAIGALLPGGAVFCTLCLDGRWRRMLDVRLTLPPLLLLAGLGFSWYLALGFAHQQGFAFMRQLFVQHHWGRFIKPMQGHSGPFFFYVPVLLLGFLPWSPFLIPAAAAVRWRKLQSEGDRFVRLWLLFAGLTFVFFSLAATKLPNYVTPVLPTCALLVAMAFGQADDEPGRMNGRAFQVAGWILGSLIALGAVFFLASPWIAAKVPDWLASKAADKEPGLLVPIDFGAAPIVAGLLLVATGTALVLARRRGAPARVVLAVLVTGFSLFAATLTQLVLPRYDAHFQAPLRRIAVQASTHVQPGEKLVLIGLGNRPSLVFYSGVEAERLGKNDTAELQARFAPGLTRVGIASRRIYEELAKSLPLTLLAQDGAVVAFGSSGR